MHTHYVWMKEKQGMQPRQWKHVSKESAHEHAQQLAQQHGGIVESVNCGTDYRVVLPMWPAKRV